MYNFCLRLYFVQIFSTSQSHLGVLSHCLSDADSYFIEVITYLFCLYQQQLYDDIM